MASVGMDRRGYYSYGLTRQQHLALDDKPEPSKEKAFSDGLGLVTMAVVVTGLPLLERTSE